MEVYVNDMMVKTKATKDYVMDLLRVFFIIRPNEGRLNTMKYVFAVTLRKYLGYMVSSKELR